MQYKKEEVRQRILNAAFREFSVQGYMKATMLSISRKARVPIGNMYRYFSCKEELFVCLVEDAIQASNAFISEINQIEIYGTNKSDSSCDGIIEQLSEKISHMAISYYNGFYLLMNQSQGSSFSDYKDVLVSEIVEFIKNKIFTANKINNDYMPEIIAKSFLHGVFAIAEKYRGLSDISRYVKELIKYLICDLSERLN